MFCHSYKYVSVHPCSSYNVDCDGHSVGARAHSAPEAPEPFPFPSSRSARPWWPSWTRWIELISDCQVER